MDYRTDPERIEASVPSKAQGSLRPPGFLTTADLAATFDIKPGTIDRMARDGRGPRYVRLPGIKGRIYRVEDIEEWMASHVFKSQADEAAHKARRC